MIAMLRGVVDSVAEDSAVVDVNGVGYLVFCSQRTLDAMPRAGGEVHVHVETHVREDHIHLYGFLSQEERSWFRLLTTVQGVGARVGLSILSTLPPDQLLTAIVAQDKAQVHKANGVGPKLAGRIVSELKDKVGGIAVSAPAAIVVDSAAADGAPNEEAVSALVNLGFSRTEAFGAVARAGQDLGSGAGVDELIRIGLRELAQ
ncbi:MAG: Holliday junction branch migration protein RuvA [Pseudomonadota bacterium]